jgi:hypothetical protein
MATQFERDQIRAALRRSDELMVGRQWQPEPEIKLKLWQQAAIDSGRARERCLIAEAEEAARMTRARRRMLDEKGSV